MNLSDSERVISVLDEAGYEWTDKEEEAGLIGILACSVRQKAIDKVYSRIHKWNKWTQFEQPKTKVIDGKTYDAIEPRQKRTCMRCGFFEDRKVRLYD